MSFKECILAQGFVFLYLWAYSHLNPIDTELLLVGVIVYAIIIFCMWAREESQ